MNKNKPAKDPTKEKLSGKEWFLQNQGADFSEVDKLVQDAEAEEIDYENIEINSEDDDEDYEDNEVDGEAEEIKD